MMRLLVSAVVLSGCSPHVNKCRDKTLFVSVTLDDTAKSADQILVEVSVDAGAPVQATLTHPPGKSMGGVEVDFPKGYPVGSMVSVTLTATLAGSTVGSGSIAKTLAGGCDALTINITSSQSPNDLAGSDGIPTDLGSPPDGADLAQTDLATNSPDLAGCSIENCFNNTDDDCDGLIDCADPDCSGGVAPQAVCVPDPGTFTLGTYMPSPSACPSRYPTPSPLGFGTLTDSSCSMGSCNCSSTVPVGSTCQAGVQDEGLDSMCGGNAWQYVPQFCQAITPIASGHYHNTFGPSWNYTSCASTTGASTKNPATFANNDLFCSGSAHGAGCPGNQVCVPAASNHCVLKTGAQLACPANYVLRTTHYYAAIKDDRTCSCLCGLMAQGDCSGASLQFFAGDTSCNTGLTSIPSACDNSNRGSVVAARIFGGPSSLGTCGPYTTSAGGPASPTTEQTVCCTP